MIPIRKTFGGAWAGLVVGSVVVAGCGDSLGPRDWDSSIDTIALFAIERPELQGLPGAYDFVSLQLRPLEALNAGDQWDIALADAPGGGFDLLVPGAVKGFEVSTGIARVDDETFEGLLEAPSDTARYERVDPVPLVGGTVFVVRSRTDPRIASCERFAKMELVESDPVRGMARLRFTRNPFCGDRALVPPDER
ncbi:MAG: hypothetical protein ABFS34_09725 [Gemmatimonadota bacterium]